MCCYFTIIIWVNLLLKSKEWVLQSKLLKLNTHQSVHRSCKLGWIFSKWNTTCPNQARKKKKHGQDTRFPLCPSLRRSPLLGLHIREHCCLFWILCKYKHKNSKIWLFSFNISFMKLIYVGKCNDSLIIFIKFIMVCFLLLLMNFTLVSILGCYEHSCNVFGEYTCTFLLWNLGKESFVHGIFSLLIPFSPGRFSGMLELCHDISQEFWKLAVEHSHF